MASKKFIITTSKETADFLISIGLKLATKDINMWTFINNNTDIGQYRLKNVSYTDKLFL